ncbi:hypothetical protein [Rehaibacterium terrae]|uniref:Uncharacterized protein n=1 Tax=Rehaibacterium terrae TaxID=1341696 RepID=A0A7W7XYT3_9GAMM|nr:hypothetical protein [Rehaibacterium terrae]MBB5014937.1 hypothetical protein [Rehaibacterium terrae]
MSGRGFDVSGTGVLDSRAGQSSGAHMQVHRADPTYRRRMLALLALSAVAGAALLGGLQYWLSHPGEDALHPLTTLQWLYIVFLGAVIALVLPLALLGLWLLRYADAIERERRYPLPGERTARDVAVREGQQATAIARRLRGLGALLWVLGAILIGWCAWTGWHLG